MTGREVVFFVFMQNPSAVAMVAAASRPNAAVPKPLPPLALAFGLAFGSALPFGLGLASAFG